MAYSRRPPTQTLPTGQVDEWVWCLMAQGFRQGWHEVFTGNIQRREQRWHGMLASLDCRTSGAAGWPSQPTVDHRDRGIATDDNLELLAASVVSTTS